MTAVFISYVREDERVVVFLRQILEINDVRVWLDREDLVPGVRWRQAIETAIRNGAFFLSIHSKQRETRHKSYANEELVVAIEEVRQRPTSKPFLIPIRIDDCEIENRHIGGGENLLDLQICDLRDWSKGLHSLLTALGVKDPKIDLGEPLAQGLPSFVKLIGGYINYEHMDGMPQVFQGIEFRVETGWCQRTPDKKLIAYIETVAPFARIQEMNRAFGLTGIHALSLEREISFDQNKPTLFSYSQDVLLPKGSELIDFSSGIVNMLPVDVHVRSAFDARGHLDGWSFLGQFTASLDFVGQGLSPRNMHGSFKLNFQPDTGAWSGTKPV